MEASKNTLHGVGKPHFFVCVRTRMQQQESGRSSLLLSVSLPLNHFRARGKFESLGIWQREREENGRSGEERRGERPLRSGTGVARQLARALTQRDQCVWLPHEEEDDDINPLFLV